MKKVLVTEANLFGAAKLIVGASKAHHRIRSSVSVAKYCARKLPKYVGIFAVFNGKIVYEREATDTNSRGKLDLDLSLCIFDFFLSVLFIYLFLTKCLILLIR